MITNHDKVNLIRFLYAICVRDLGGHVVVRPIDETMATFDNCVAFYGLSNMLGLSLYDVMMIGLAVYPERWLREKFGNPYPPFTIAVGEKIRNEIVKSKPVLKSNDNPEVRVNQVAISLSSFDKETAVDLIESGVMVGNDKKVKRLLLKKLSEEALIHAGKPDKEWKWKKIKSS